MKAKTRRLFMDPPIAPLSQRTPLTRCISSAKSETKVRRSPNAQTQPRRQICVSKFGDVGWSALLGGIHEKLGHLTGRARLRLVIGSLELSHVELHHRHHGFHHSLHLPGVPITDQLGESSRDNLPGETEGVCDPTALRGLRSCFHELVPVFIHFILIRAVHVERDPLGEAEVRTSVVAHEELTTNDELCGADGTVIARAGDVAYFGVRKRRSVELDRRFELVVEHEERCHFVHGSVSYVKAMLFCAQRQVKRARARRRSLRCTLCWAVFIALP